MFRALKPSNRPTFVLAALVVGVVLVLAVYYRYEHSVNAALAAPKTWEARALGIGNGRASLRTVWRQGRVLYQLHVQPYPAEVAAAVKSPASIQQHFTMEFLDADGFRLLSLSIRPAELGFVVGPDGALIAIEARGDRDMARELYTRTQKWSIRWGFD